MNEIKADITDFKHIDPVTQIAQEQIVSWMTDIQIEATEPNSDRKKELTKLRERYSVKSDQIASRGFECAEVGEKDPEKRELFRFDRKEEGRLGKKSRFFIKRSREILKQIYNKEDQAPDHIVHVSCTGYVSPSAPQHLVNEQGWSTQVTHAYHMGCYASLPAIRMAQGFVAAHQLSDQRNEDFSADVVHTEMCGLHYSPELNTAEQLVVQSLFADGSIKYSIKTPRSAKRGFHLYHTEERIIPSTTDQMTWVPESYGFRMTLGRDVPTLIRTHVRTFVLDMFKKAGWDLSRDYAQAQFAIHPGGPRIIDAVQEALELTQEQTQESRNVLKDRGNMSSATLPHIWERIAERMLPSGTPVISLAFGPGLTVFGSLFRTI